MAHSEPRGIVNWQYHKDKDLARTPLGSPGPTVFSHAIAFNSQRVGTLAMDAKWRIVHLDIERASQQLPPRVSDGTLTPVNVWHDRKQDVIVLEFTPGAAGEGFQAHQETFSIVVRKSDDDPNPLAVHVLTFLRDDANLIRAVVVQHASRFVPSLLPPRREN